MKKNDFIALSSVLIFCTNLCGQIQLDCNGNIGIGTTSNSSYKLTTSGYSYFSGDVGIGIPPISTYQLRTPSSSQSYFGKVKIDYSQPYTPALEVSSSTYGAPVVYISGSSPNYLLCVNGDAYTTGSWISSDFQLKKNIKDLNGIEILNKIKNINGKSYEFKNKEELKSVYKNSINDSIYQTPELRKGEQYGLIAQEIEEVFPELVKLDSATNLKAINYDGMIPILLQAIKEQQVVIEKLQSEIQKLKNNSDSGSKLKSATITGTSTIDDNSTNALYQNAPNPFSQSTTIEYSVAENVQKAMICIYDMNGTQLKCIPLHLTGYGNITINGSELQAGMYMYSLIADGQLIDTKRMILTD